MFLKSLKISNKSGVIRDIGFHKGLNLIVDETTGGGEETGNNIGKTTVLMLIDYCLGAGGKSIYTDPENKKNEYLLVKNFLIETEVITTLTLTSNLDGGGEELVIERNFLPRKKMIRRINGQQKTEEEFDEALTEHLFPGHYGKKPTFSQIISHNIRYKEISLTNTLYNLNSFTKNEEYETLYLFLLGCDFDQGNHRQQLLTQLKVETGFKARLESQQTRSAYEASLAILTEEIAELNERRSAFQVNQNFEGDLHSLDKTKYSINSISASIGRLKLRRSLVLEAVQELESGKANIDIEQMKSLYTQASSFIPSMQKSFEDLLAFHNQMIEEKVKYIVKDLPTLNASIEKEQAKLQAFLSDESTLVSKIAKSGSFEELERIIVELNEKHKRVGEYEAIIQQIAIVENSLENLQRELGIIDGELFSTEFEAAIQAQLNKLNKYFSAVSYELYGERYAVKVDRTVTTTGQRVYKFNTFNTNFSSGKKQGEITCFDIAYTLFADEENIPCYHFLLNDKKELMHDNQLARIAALVERESAHVQYVASILRDKLPSELNDDRYFILELSQTDKLFKIESGNRATI